MTAPDSQDFEVTFQAESEAPPQKNPRRWYLRIGHRRFRFAAIVHPSSSGLRLVLASPMRETTRDRPAKGARVFARRKKAAGYR